VAGSRTKQKPRTRKGNWGVFGGGRLFYRNKEEKAKDRLSQMREGRRERQAETKVSRKEDELKRKMRLEQAEAGYYEAKKRKMKAKKQSSRWQPLPTKTVKVKRKKQGKRLSSGSRIRLI